MRQQQYRQQHPKFGVAMTELEEKYIAALGDIDCDEYTHRDLCLYLLEVIHESLYSRRKLRDLERLLWETITAISKITGE